MPSIPTFHLLGRFLLAWAAVAGLAASEHHGIVKSAGIPVPGATVTAVQGDKKIATTTDDSGAYDFPDLADGIWTINIEMLGFAKVSNEVAVAAQSPNPEWDLKMLSASDLKAALAPPAPAATKTADAAPAPATPNKAADTAAPKPAATT